MKNKKLVAMAPVLLVLLILGAVPARAANTPDITLGSFRIQSTDKSGYDREAVVSFSYLLNGNCSVLKIFMELYPEDDTDEIFESKVVSTDYNNVTQGTTPKTYSGIMYIDEGDQAFEDAAIAEEDDIICRIRLYNNTITAGNLLVTEYLEDEYPSLVAVEAEPTGIAAWGWQEWGVFFLAIIGGIALVCIVYAWYRRRGHLIP